MSLNPKGYRFPLDSDRSYETIYLTKREDGVVEQFYPFDCHHGQFVKGCSGSRCLDQLPSLSKNQVGLMMSSMRLSEIIYIRNYYGSDPVRVISSFTPLTKAKKRRLRKQKARV